MTETSIDEILSLLRDQKLNYVDSIQEINRQAMELGNRLRYVEGKLDEINYLIKYIEGENDDVEISKSV